MLKLAKALDFLKRRLDRLLIASGPDKRSFSRFKNEISLIISDFDKRAEELEQYYTEKGVNPEVDQLLVENVLFKQKFWREFDAIKASLECGSEDSYPSCSDTTPNNRMDLTGLVVLPKLKCTVFVGNTVNKLAFKKFLAQFENLVSDVKSSACKFQILKSYLSGYSAQVIEHLSVSDENYFVALDLLRSEFLDLDFIKSQIFTEILSHELKAEFDLDALRTFLYASESQPLGAEILLLFEFYG